MSEAKSSKPALIKRKKAEALAVLQVLGLPQGQHNQRSALTLLALLGLKPDLPWAEATAPMLGITPIMNFCRDYYGTTYAPNTRETFRRATIHQFVAAGLVIANPDDPTRQTNNPKTRYQIEATVLKLLRTLNTVEWPHNLTNYLASIETLKQHYARERAINKVPVTLADGAELHLTPGRHSQLIRAIVEEFAPRFAPGGKVIYVGDTGDKWAYFDEAALQSLGVTVDLHGKMPDVVVYFGGKDWLLLIEAVTSHGPVDAKRRDELAKLFKTARPGLVYVTTFLDRKDLARYLKDISWSTDVWIAEAATHLVHFDGERFLGPYDN
jgi:hypothetical protein